MVRLASGRKLSTSSQTMRDLTPGVRPAFEPVLSPSTLSDRERERSVPYRLLHRCCIPGRPPASASSCRSEQRRDIRDTTDRGEICIIWLPDWPTSASPIGVPPMHPRSDWSRRSVCAKGSSSQDFQHSCARACRSNSDPRVGVPICAIVRIRYGRT